MKGPDDMKTYTTCIAKILCSKQIYETDIWIFCADLIVSGQHCQPARSLPFSPAVFSESISAASQRGHGTQGLAGSRAPFVSDQDYYSARALSSVHNKLEIPSFQGDQRVFD